MDRDDARTIARILVYVVMVLLAALLAGLAVRLFQFAAFGGS